METVALAAIVVTGIVSLIAILVVAGLHPGRPLSRISAILRDLVRLINVLL